MIANYRPANEIDRDWDVNIWLAISKGKSSDDSSNGFNRDSPIAQLWSTRIAFNEKKNIDN